MVRNLYTSQCISKNINVNLKIVMCGNHIGGKDIIEFLLNHGITFSYFIILSERQAKEYNVSGYYDYSSLAEKWDIPVYYPKSFNLKDASDLEFFQKNNFDLLIQGGWQRLFPNDILNTLSIGALGTHGGSDFLPKFRGRSPMNWSLIENKKRFIMQLFLMKDGIDDGNIIDWFTFDITRYDNIQTLYFKYSISLKHLILRNIESLFNGSYKTKKQIGVPTYYKKRTAIEGQINWEIMDVYEIYNIIRATTKPYPCAFSFIESEKIILIEATIFDTSIIYPNAKYGELVEIFEGNNILVNCMGGLLLVKLYEYNQKIKVGMTMEYVK